MGGSLYGTHLWQASKMDRKWVTMKVYVTECILYMFRAMTL